MAEHEDELPYMARVPADIGREDRIAFGLSAKQLVIATLVAGALWLLHQATRTVWSLSTFALASIPVTATTIAVLTIRRDGLGLHDLLWAAIKQLRAPRRLVPSSAPAAATPEWVTAKPGALPAPLKLPATAITAEGAIELGRDGAAALAVCSGVNFGLRTAGEQNALIAGFARWLHSLSGPAQIVVQACRLDLDPVIDRLTEAAPALPHRALESACLDHAQWLAELSESRELLRRQILLVSTEPARAGAAQIALRRTEDAARGLGAAEVTVWPVDAGQIEAVLAAAVDPTNPTGTVPADTHFTGVVTGARRTR
ncbi:PrgI family protein [Pseudonocardiaceae bacterium YIM PH 21723]|nr:PrgI family protein [Pseudonocardiaceae bacterium YIM PH 21723]